MCFGARSGGYSYWFLPGKFCGKFIGTRRFFLFPTVASNWKGTVAAFKLEPPLLYKRSLLFYLVLSCILNNGKARLLINQTKYAAYLRKKADIDSRGKRERETQTLRQKLHDL